MVSQTWHLSLLYSCILEVRVEDVWPTPAHLRPFNVCRTSVELGLVPLALLHLIPPLHALLGGHLRLGLELVHLQAAELLDLEVLAGVLRGVLVDLLREAGHGEADVVGGLRR